MCAAALSCTLCSKRKATASTGLHASTLTPGRGPAWAPCTGPAHPMGAAQRGCTGSRWPRLAAAAGQPRGPAPGWGVAPAGTGAQACFTCWDLMSPTCHAAHRPRLRLGAGRAGRGRGVPDMLGAGNKGTPCRMSKGPRHCSGSSMHVTGGAHAGSPDKEASGIRLQAAAWDEVCTCGAERTATLLTVALPALWRRWRVVTPCADTASCVTSSNATALSACRTQVPRAVRGAD